MSNMKAKIIVTPKKAVLDPQGKTVQNALEHIGFKGIKDVRIGKYIEVESITLKTIISFQNENSYSIFEMLMSSD